MSGSNRRDQDADKTPGRAAVISTVILLFTYLIVAVARSGTSQEPVHQRSAFLHAWSVSAAWRHRYGRRVHQEPILVPETGDLPAALRSNSREQLQINGLPDGYTWPALVTEAAVPDP